MRSSWTTKATFFGLLGCAAVIGSLSGCDTSNLTPLPLAQVSAVQLFDQPNYTVAFSVQDALNNPSLVSTINWVLGDGSGYVAGPAGKTSITHVYSATGVYAVTAYVFQGSELAATIAGSATVEANDNGTTPTPTPALPGKISGANPRNKATDVAVAVKLTWTSGTNATSHDVYLGTVEANVTSATVSSAEYEGTITVASFDPGGLTPETQYYWRIDERNSGGVTTGDVLTFTTAKAPTKAKDFVPVNGVTTAPVTQVLQWTSGKNTTSHDVYFGKDQTAVANATKDTTDIFKGNQSGTSYDPEDSAALIDGQLLATTTYYWRIDEVGQGGTAKGDVLQFKTIDPPPAGTNPIPANGAIDVDVDAILEWSAAVAITSFDVYFGTDSVAVGNATHSNTEFKSNVTTKTYNPGTMLGAFTYYWRIDTLGSGGTSKGAVFTFTTAAPPPQVVGPFTPANNATDVAYTTDLGWAAGAGGGATDSFNVYFSTSQTSVTSGESAALKGNIAAANTTYDPNDLTADTQYYWRIDAVGPGGTTAGTIQTFRVGALPGQVINTPTPANGATARPLNQQLSWLAGVGAVQHDVYFGTTQSQVSSATVSDASYKGRQAGLTFNPGTLEGNTTYYWRIDEVAPGGQTKGPIWNFKTVPAAASNPDPLDQDTGIELSPTLSWTAGDGAVSHDVYFGTVAADVLSATTATTGIFKGNQSGTTWTPSTALSGVTAYYWRIDEVGSATDGTTKGTVWKFTTGAGQAAVPILPLNGATGVSLDPTLTWHAGAGAVSHDVYFGTSQSVVNSATHASTEYQGNLLLGTEFFDVAGPLTGNTNYYWRIDELDVLNNATKGIVWQFRTGTGAASSPSPADLAKGIDVNANLSWTAGSGATSHDVYIGTALADVTNATTATPTIYKGNQAATTFDPGLLDEGVKYYWRIDEVGAGGTTKGTVWAFTCGAGQATDPDPADGASGIALTPLLSWTPAAASTSQDVYFGTSFTAVRDATRTSAEFQGNQVLPNFSAGVLGGMTFYYWRIDSVNADGTTKGEVWQFRTGPGKASAPTPTDFATGVAVSTTMKWTAGTGAVWHHVYFSSTLADVVSRLPAADKGLQSGTTYGTSLATGTTYYWRIDEVAADGTTTSGGDVWRFTTVP